MKGAGHLRRMGILAAAFGLLCGPAGCASVQTSSTAKPASGAQVQEKHVAATPVQAVIAPSIVNAPYYPAPSSIDLCGEPVPLHMQEVYERFDKEFTLVVYNHAQVYLWLKRMERYFPAAEELLRRYNLPDDLKYVAIVESDLLPNACSPKGAAGPWQFMPSTGSAYGLDQKGSVDKRYDYEKSTESAFLFLSDLYKRYKNWSLAIAAYNCGDKRILDQSRAQGVRDYYQLKLPQETERYVFRILAIKAVLSNPAQYGYDLPKGWGYQELKLDKVKVAFSRPTSIQAIANAAGMTYREFKRLNPVFRADDIPAGNHEIKLPAGYGKSFEQSFRGGSTQVASSESPVVQKEDSTPPPAAAVSAPAPVRPEPAKAQPKPQQQDRERSHVVKKGDTLSAIARHYSVSTQALKDANKLKSSDLTPGQKLRIP
ncbi:MAG: transglycosylase SLT domain-containing protein [Syntrophobacteraceae bacterium]